MNQDFAPKAAMAEIKPTPRDSNGLYDYRLYIDGEFVPAASGESFETSDPVAGEAWARVARGTYAPPRIDRASPARQ